MAHLVIPESLDIAEVEQFYDLTVVWLRDCIRKRDIPGIQNAEFNLKQLNSLLAEKFGEA